jgi:hypothetical protein
MLDAAQFERRGCPTVTVAHDNFAAAARVHARSVSLPLLPLAVFPRPQPGWDKATVGRVLAELRAAVECGLLGR